MIKRRAFATNTQGTAYGQEQEFRTEDALLPQVQTLKLERGGDEDGEIVVSAQLDELGIPAHEGHGACIGATKLGRIYSRASAVSTASGDLKGAR